MDWGFPLLPVSCPFPAGCRTLLATHFHSLSGFSRQSSNIGAYKLVAKRSDSGVTFTYQIEVQYVCMCMCEYIHVHVGYSVSGHVCL